MTWRAVQCGSLLLLLVATLLQINARAVESGSVDVDRHLRDLQSVNADVRVDAVRQLQTSLDPRIPEAMLRLLADEGNSIRRLASRAIGSRWWQIPQQRAPEFVAALRRNAAHNFEDEQNMVARAIGLLTRDFSGKMFARSTNGRWVIYERLGLPCLIDTKSGTEELFGWSGKDRAGWLAPAWGNGPLAESAFWHPQRESVALAILLNRRETAVWIWKHGSALRQLETEALMKALGIAESQLHRAGGVFTEIKGWNGDELPFDVSFSIVNGESYVEHTAVLAWNAESDKLRVISRAKR